MTKVSVGENVVIHRDPFAYVGHPSLAQLDNSEWVVAFNHSRRWNEVRHPTEDPLYRTLVARSSDMGQTWDEPYFVPDLERCGTETPGISQLSDGTVVLTEFKYTWYPLPLARKLHSQGAEVFIPLPESNVWVSDIGDGDWERTTSPWARAAGGLSVYLSEDRGYTFEGPIAIDPAPYRDGCNRTGVLELSDGRVMHAVIEQHRPRNERCIYAVFSDTRGKSWGPPVAIAHSFQIGSGIGEPSICEVSPGDLYCVLRGGSSGRFSHGYLYGCRSSDGGQTWSVPKVTSMYGHPGHVFRMSDGRLVCTYGRREEPFGIYGCVSEDSGHTWDMSQEFMIRELPNADLGYSTAIEYRPDEVFVAYYGQDSEGVTGIHGTYVTLS